MEYSEYLLLYAIFIVIKIIVQQLCNPSQPERQCDWDGCSNNAQCLCNQPCVYVGYVE